MDPRRLCHISDLPNNLHYLPIEIKHLLPVHHPKFIDNLNTIVKNQGMLQEWWVYPDVAMTINNPNYGVMTGGWCEDIDGEQHHLKASLELSAIVLNYLQSLIQTPSSDQQLSVSETINRKDHQGLSGTVDYVSFPVTIAYNIYKTKDKNNKKKLIFLAGQHRSPRMRLYAMANAVRSWNLHRLKSDMCKEMSPNRIHQHVEHLLGVVRGFLGLREDDHQAKKKQIQQNLLRLEPQYMPKEVPREGIEEGNEVILSRFEWVYKGNLSQKEIENIVADALIELINMMPTNVACSYAGRSYFDPTLNLNVLSWMTVFSKKSQSSIKVTQDGMEKAVTQCTAFLRVKTVEQIKNVHNNIADEMIRSSIKTLSRYAPEQGGKRREWGQLSQVSRVKDSSNKSSVIDQRIRKEGNDGMSVISRISFKDTQSVRDGRQRLDAQFQSLSSPLMIHRDRQYGELLGQITNWQQMNGVVPPWSELKGQLRKNCEIAKLRYSRSDLTTGQSELLLSLVAIRSYLDTDDFLLLLKYHTEYREALFEVLFQGSASSFLHGLGLKIAREYARSLYEVYLTKEFNIDNTNLLTMYLKKLVSTFAENTPLPSISDKINIPLLIELLEGRQLLSEKYKSLASTVLPQIFKPSKSLLLICPILLQVYLALGDDHHQELVNSLLGDLAFEVIYFHHDKGEINNSPYRKEMDLKQKKVLELLRRGGFSSLGFQLRNTLKPHIIEHSNYTLPPTRIYHQIVIKRPLQLGRFVELIATSTLVQQFSQITNYYQSMQNTANNVTRSIANAYLGGQVEGFKWGSGEEGIGQGVLKSESGIFAQLLEYNPQIKLAGRSLSEVVKTHAKSKGIPVQRFDADHVLSTLFRQNLQQIYEYILIAINVRQKYQKYSDLLQDERIYMREIVHQVLCRRTQILDYLQVAMLARRALEMETPHLF